jgi:hypothetical protein
VSEACQADPSSYEKVGRRTADFIILKTMPPPCWGKMDANGD